MHNMKETLYKYALQNALKFGGKANLGAVIGKAIQEMPDAKSDMKGLAKQAAEAVKEANKLPAEEQRKILEEKYPELLEKKQKEERKLPELPNAVEGKVVMRLAPYPSGPLHIGNTKTYILNDEYAKHYKGKLLLVIDDTIGSAEKSIAEEAYKLIPEGLDWLGFAYDKDIIYKSDRLEHYYKYARELIGKGKAYVCFCNAETLRSHRDKKEDCSCRARSVKDNLSEFESMLSGKYAEGSAVLRLKTSMQHENPAFRDRVIMRISERPHPRTGTKYRVWPLLDFSWAVDDQLLGITHIMRGKELMIESEMEKFIWDIFGWPHKEIIHTALMKIEGVKLSKSKSRKEVMEGMYFGWDDPRTWSLQALKRRGFLPEAIRNFVLSFGLHQNEITVPVDTLYAENRKLIDPTAPRYFFVEDPVELKVAGAPEQRLAINLHPEQPAMGSREIKTGDSFYITRADMGSFKAGKLQRLMDCLNFTKKGRGFVFDSLDHETFRKKGEKIIHWVAGSSHVDAEVLMPDASVVKGYAENALSQVKPGTVVQLQRFGFCRLDRKEGNKLVFWFSHK